MISTRAPGGAARRMANRMATACASGQSWITSIRRYASAAGSGSTKKSPGWAVSRSQVEVERVGHVVEVEQDSFRPGRLVEHRTQEMPVATANVSDRVETREVIGAEDGGDVGGGFGRHGLAEDPSLMRVPFEVGPEATVLHESHGGRAR